MTHFGCRLQNLEKHSTRINEISSSSETSKGIPMLKELIQSQEKTLLFPEHIGHHLIPFRPTVSNLDKVLDRFSLVVYSHCKPNGAVLTLGKCYKCPSGVASNMTIYGDESSDSLTTHLAKHMRECLKIGCANVASDSGLFRLVVHSNYGKTDKHLENISKFLSTFGVLRNETKDSIQYCIEEDI